MKVNRKELRRLLEVQISPDAKIEIGVLQALAQLEVASAVDAAAEDMRRLLSTIAQVLGEMAPQ